MNQRAVTNTDRMVLESSISSLGLGVESDLADFAERLEKRLDLLLWCSSGGRLFGVTPFVVGVGLDVETEAGVVEDVEA